MNEKTTLVRSTLLDDGSVVRILEDGSTRAISETDTDWLRVDAMSVDDVEANALSDPDSAAETEDEIGAIWGAAYLKDIRLRMNLTQVEFSARFQIPLGTLRDWERGASTPDASARTLLRVIAREPEVVGRALAR